MTQPATPSSSFTALVSAMFTAAFGYAAIMPPLPELLVALLPQASAIGISRHAGALAASGGLGQALGSVSGGVLYGYAGAEMFAATAFAVALGAWLGSRTCAPRWLGGESGCSRN